MDGFGGMFFVVVEHTLRHLASQFGDEIGVVGLGGGGGGGVPGREELSGIGARAGGGGGYDVVFVGWVGVFE